MALKTLDSDLNLVRKVFSEKRNGYTIDAFLTRFGGLHVFVSNDLPDVVWQGENVLVARRHVDGLPEIRSSGIDHLG